MTKIIGRLTGFIDWILGILLATMLLITFVQVVLRYVFNSPLIWAEEVTLILLVWYGYLIIAVLIKHNGHIALEFLYIKMNRRMQKLLDVIKYALILCFAILMIYFGMEMTNNAAGKYFPVSQIPRAFINIPMAISGILMVVYSMHHLISLFKPIGTEAETRK